jgi:hypothetical protein
MYLLDNNIQMGGPRGVTPDSGGAERPAPAKSSTKKFLEGTATNPSGRHQEATAPSGGGSQAVQQAKGQAKSGGFASLGSSPRIRPARSYKKTTLEELKQRPSTKGHTREFNKIKSDIWKKMGWQKK